MEAKCTKYSSRSCKEHGKNESSMPIWDKYGTCETVRLDICERREGEVEEGLKWRILDSKFGVEREARSSACYGPTSTG